MQCCGAGAGGAEIILEPGAGAEKNFNKHFLQSTFLDAWKQGLYA